MTLAYDLKGIGFACLSKRRSNNKMQMSLGDQTTGLLSLTAVESRLQAKALAQMLK